MDTQYQARVANIERILLLENLAIDEQQLREECKYGIHDKLRPLVWRLFLGFLPAQRHKWAETLQKQRTHYAALVDQFLAGPEESDRIMSSTRGNNEDFCAENDCNILSNDDHPLAEANESNWNSWFRDNGVIRQINNDVKRLRPEIDFFQRPTSYARNTRVKLSERLNCSLLKSDAHVFEKLADKSFISPNSSISISFDGATSTPNISLGRIDYINVELHCEVVERILFLFAKTNRGIGYVQGFNEILCPIYFVFASDVDDEWAQHAEADSFYCFQNMISEIQDLFIRRMDSECCGIEAVLTRFYAKLKICDPKLFSHLEHQQMKPQYFAFRWISLLLSQEFLLPDLIAIWDFIFASLPGARLERVESFCLALLAELRDILLTPDFAHNLRILQNFSESLGAEMIPISRLIVRSLEMSAKIAQHTEESNEDDPNNNDNCGSRSADILFSPARLSAFRPSAKSVSEMKSKFRNLLDNTAAKFSTINFGENSNNKNSTKSSDNKMQMSGKKLSP